MSEKIGLYYQRQGKDIVDMLFDGKLFHQALTRNDLQVIEDYIAYVFQMNARSAERGAQFLLSIKKTEKK